MKTDYKLGDYTVAAVIEHGEEDKNLVYPCGDYKIPNKYNTGKGICEHCYGTYLLFQLGQEAELK